MQIQADLLGASVVRPKDAEATAFGSAFAAGLATGLWQLEQGRREETEDVKVYTSRIGAQERRDRMKKWDMAVERSLNWAPKSHHFEPRGSFFRRLFQLTSANIVPLAIGAALSASVAVYLRHKT